MAIKSVEKIKQSSPKQPITMPTPIDIEHFLALWQSSPILDVRTPAEFAQGHIPQALNVPLFSNEERAVVGTAYKHKGRNDALLLGLDFVGVKMRSLVERAQQAAQSRNTRTLGVHCWRGGMRSSSVAWLLDMAGYKVFTLEGGYKAFRRYTLDSLALQRDILILGGKTGSGKTHILHKLHELGEQTLDLERIAQHKGSAFGAIGEQPQPTQEQFENNLAQHWRTLDAKRRVWVEDESNHIGRSYIPKPVWEQMRHANALFLDMPLELRVHNTLADYGAATNEALIASVCAIEKRLGGLATRHALEALDRGDRAETVRIALRYYDKAYLHGLSQREPRYVRMVQTESRDTNHNAELLLQAITSHIWE
jgi:tRNA 2-selenouridine synthase